MAWSILPSNCDSAIAEVKANRNQIADLKRQLEEASSLAKRCSDWGEERRQSALDACEMAMQRKEENEALRQQLAESQAREAQLREALERIVPRFCVGYETKSDALALQHDDSSLREYRNAVIEGCIATLEQAKIKTDNHLLRPGLCAAIKEIKLYEEAVRNISKGV